MDVERLCRMRPQRLHHLGANGDVGHKMAVHDVDMDPVGAGRVDRAHLLAELGEVGRQDGWSDGERAMHRGLRFDVRLTLPHHKRRSRSESLPDVWAGDIEDTLGPPFGEGGRAKARSAGGLWASIEESKDP